MLADYIFAGFPADQFWRITLREYMVHMGAAGKRIEAEHKNRAWLAHTTASLTRMDGKKFPKLDDLMPKKKKAQHPLQMEQIARMWDAAINKKAI